MATLISSGGDRAPLARVLTHALETGIEPDYARSLIKRRALVPEKSSRFRSTLALDRTACKTFGGFA